MDFDDQDNKPKEVTKTRRFAPCRVVKSKPKPLDSQDVEAKFPVPCKVEAEVYIGSVKMEIDSKLNKEPETTESELMMELDQIPLGEEEEEEDVVVRETDVFFNPSIEANNTKLYVLQYPLRPSWRPYEMDERCQQVRVNPSTCQVEVDLSMDIHSRNYDSEFASMTKQTLTTTWKQQPPWMDYAIGVLSGDKITYFNWSLRLHLNPVHAVAQLRPSTQYFSFKKKQAEALEESAITSKELNWVSLKYLKGMMANDNSSIDFNMSSELYINSLCRGGNSETKHSWKRVLTSLPIEERVQKMLCQGPHLFQYSVLKHYAPELSDEDFLKVIQQYAWLVQGLWTPKTRLLKLDGPLEASRDHVLMLFSKGSTIKYSDIEATGRLRDKIKTMLTVFAKERPLLCDWKLKVPTDVSFIKSYPDIAKEQAALWKATDEKLTSKITQGGGKSRVVDNSRNVIGKNPSATVEPEISITLSDKEQSSKTTTPLHM
ncbi:PREDICTED: uncharacterized protein LOC104753445 [Camelina sativa]|uniref:Uncharacterized protein LOC104753445 n=1 Tax=Camelina sativa TaxID=90675 RepID=A0ABM0WP59_CAMSA|nr:PREDICTED: uncharacterized protein LOC104753445 [Camelina sativa]